MLDGLTLLLALPDFLRSPRYPRGLRITVLIAVMAAFAAALVVAFN
jgi:hypothetical protein